MDTRIQTTRNEGAPEPKPKPRAEPVQKAADTDAAKGRAVLSMFGFTMTYFGLTVAACTHQWVTAGPARALMAFGVCTALAGAVVFLAHTNLD